MARGRLGFQLRRHLPCSGCSAHEALPVQLQRRLLRLLQRPPGHLLLLLNAKPRQHHNARAGSGQEPPVSAAAVAADRAGRQAGRHTRLQLVQRRQQPRLLALAAPPGRLVAPPHLLQLHSGRHLRCDVGGTEKGARRQAADSCSASRHRTRQAGNMRGSVHSAGQIVVCKWWASKTRPWLPNSPSTPAGVPARRPRGWPVLAPLPASQGHWEAGPPPAGKLGNESSRGMDMPARVSSPGQTACGAGCVNWMPCTLAAAQG